MADPAGSEAASNADLPRAEQVAQTPVDDAQTAALDDAPAHPLSPQARPPLPSASRALSTGATVENLASSSELVMLEAPRSRAAEAIREIRIQLLAGAWRGDEGEASILRSSETDFVSPDQAPSPDLLEGPDASRRALAVVGTRTISRAQLSLPSRRALAIVSRRSGEGRSFVAANLAISLAQSGARVVLVDADLHGSRLHTMFGVTEPTQGLIQMVHQGASLALITPVASLPKLNLLPAGSPTDAPIDLLQRDRLGSVLQNLTRRFDYVVVDTPASERSADWQVIAMTTGLVALLVRTGVSRVDELKAIARQLNALRVETAGVIVNG